MNSPEPRLSWSEAVQPRSWPLPVKLIAVVAVPALFAITLGTLRVLDQSQVADDFDRVDRVAALQEQVSQLGTELQDERTEAVQFVAVRDRQNPAPFEAATSETEKARDETTRLLGDQTDLNSGTVGTLRQFDNTYFRLTQLRRQVLTGANDAPDLFAQYSVVIEPLLVVDSALTRQLSNPEISGLSQGIGALAEARDQVAAQQALVDAVLDAGRTADPQVDALRAADARLSTATSTVRSVLNDEQQTRYTSFAGTVAGTREQLKQSVVDRGRADLAIEVSPQAWNDASAAVLKEIDAAEDGARSELREISAAQQDDASNEAGVNSVFLLLAVLLGAGIVYLVAKALISSLRTLRVAALDVAQRRLPEAVQSMRDGAVPDIDVAPVPVTTREEIGQVARAFDAVHSQAVRLAAEQATLQSNVSSMFANLSRRSQALAERQLKLIEQLESNEQDPDQLSNLFQLDSLATRMRRNSENLLVLSGTDLSKRATQPVPVVDVLRAAVSEVEQYQRVVVQSPPDATIAGRAASDIVHLLAELVDNATNYSAPDTQVVMSSQRTPDGSVLIEIVDRGVGMSGGDLDDANQRLAHPTALDVSVSRRMGLFVVGRLAARHGLGVRLGNPATGTTASVMVPAYLVTGAMGGEQYPPTAQPVQVMPGPPPGRDFVPTPRPGTNGSGRPAPLSALVAGADAPVGSPGGPAPLATSRAVTGQPSTVNGRYSPPVPNGVESDARPQPSAPVEPAEPGPDAEELPTRRPGQLLGQAPPASPTAPAAQEKPRPGELDERGGPRRWPAAEPAAERSGPQEPVRRPMPPSSSPMPAPDVAPTTEAFAAQSPDQTPRASALPPTAPARSRPQPGPAQTPLNQAPPNQQSQQFPARSAPQERPTQQPLPVDQRADTSVPAAPTARPQTSPVQIRPAPLPHPSDQPVRPSGPPQPGTRPQGRTTVPPTPRPPTAGPPVPDAGPGTGAAPLFAPASVEPSPAAEDSDAPASTNGPRPPRSASDPSETTPIFEEIASAWFREDRPVPVTYDEELDAVPADQRPALPRRSVTPGPRPDLPPAPASAPLPRRTPAPAPLEPAVVNQPRPAPTAPSPPAPASQPMPIAVPSAFATVADDGWRASAAAAEVAGDELTQAGLPKRRPRARLVPGAAATSATPPGVSPARTAESIRGRLSSYQDGVRQGRELRLRREASTSNAGSSAATNSRTIGNRDEETS